MQTFVEVIDSLCHPSWQSIVVLVRTTRPEWC